MVRGAGRLAMNAGVKSLAHLTARCGWLTLECESRLGDLVVFVKCCCLISSISFYRGCHRVGCLHFGSSLWRWEVHSLRNCSVGVCCPDPLKHNFLNVLLDITWSSHALGGFPQKILNSRGQKKKHICAVILQFCPICF